VQQALLITLVAASYLLFAGGPVWSRQWIWVLAIITALSAPRRTFTFPAHTRSLDIALLAILAAILIQLIPLPAGMVEAVSPHAMRVRSATRLTVQSPSWLPLSIDGGATLQAALAMALGIVVFWTARGAFSGGASTRQFCRSVAWLAGLFAVTALVQRGVRPGLVLGILATETRNANPIGAFTNRNHFAAWLLMASVASLGYLIAHLQIHPAYRERFGVALRHFLASGAMFTGICALIAVTALLMSLSRSGAAGFGVAALTGAWLGRSRLRIERTHLPKVLGAVGIAIVFLALFTDVEGWFTRFQESVGVGDFDRPTIWRESLPIFRDFFFTGTGAGTYSHAMTQYQQSRVWIGALHGWAHFNNAHSHYVQVACEGGLLLILPLAAAAAALVRVAIRTIRADKGEMFWVRIGAAAAIAGIAAQSVWEVSLLMPANAVLFGAIAGLLLYKRDPARPPTSSDVRPA
jgi:O-antigen ligase